MWWELQVFPRHVATWGFSGSIPIVCIGTPPLTIALVRAEGACTAGGGDGEYEPLAAPAAVVAVVGTAHVRGIIREWKKAGSDMSLDRYLTL